MVYVLKPEKIAPSLEWFLSKADPPPQRLVTDFEQPRLPKWLEYSRRLQEEMRPYCVVVESFQHMLALAEHNFVEGNPAKAAAKLWLHEEAHRDASVKLGIGGHILLYFVERVGTDRARYFYGSFEPDVDQLEAKVSTPSDFLLYEAKALLGPRRVQEDYPHENYVALQFWRLSRQLRGST